MIFCAYALGNHSAKGCSPFMRQFSFKILIEGIFANFKLIFFEFPLAQSNRDWKNPYQVYSEPYQTEDAHMLEEVIKNMDINPQFSMKEVEERIKDDHLFYVAKKSGKIIGYCWYLVRLVNVPEFDITLYLKPDEVCSVNSYIQPQFRGKGIRNYMRAYEYNQLREKGFKRSLTFVNSNNKPSLRMHQKWGSVPVGMARRINILTFTYHYTNLKTHKIVFHGGAFSNWKKLSQRIKM